MLATNLARAGYEVRVFDYTGSHARIDEYFREIRDFQPGMVGMACFTPYVASLHRISTRLREAVPEAAMVIGGYHPTVLPVWTLENMP